MIQAINKHLNLVKKSWDLRMDSSNEHEKILRKYENYALTNMNFSVDRIRYNVKTVFERLIELYNQLRLQKSLRDVVGKVLSLPWVSKSKSICLAAIAKDNIQLLLELAPSLPSKVAELMLDPTMESGTDCN